MTDYDFHTLSPIDFEYLVRDVLQAEWGIQLESFKCGQDQGIDLRYCEDDTKKLIVQCKHYYKSGIKGLLKNLKNIEKDKVVALNPTRYILATSVPVSPNDKKAIIEIFSPFIHNPSDIYGKEDINNLLGIHVKIEKKHFKLWLSSLSVLEEILHSRIINDSRLTLEDIKNKSKYYVINESFSKAVEILSEYNYCIVAGLPGIGKTILAQMLILHFLKEEYDFINISYDINDALAFHGKGQKCVYFYDDFLGRTSLSEKLRKNEDQRLFRFLESLRISKSSKLLLTTREYILRQAQTTYEVLNNPLFEKPQCIIDLEQYTRPIKSQILYNHLFFSELSDEFVNEIINQHAYLKIIDHENFNPRLIEYMTDPIWIANHKANEYPSIFLKNLNNPYLIWKEAFKNQLEEISRNLLIVLSTLPNELFLADLISALRYYYKIIEQDFKRTSFEQSLKILDDNFIKIYLDRDNEIVAFHNPSIQDFVESYLFENGDLHISLIKSSIFFEQLEWILQRPEFFNSNDQLPKDLEASISSSLIECLWASPCKLINVSFDKGKTIQKLRYSIYFGQRIAMLAALSQKKVFSFLSKIVLDNLAEIASSIRDHTIDNFDLINLLKHIMPLNYISKEFKDELLTISKESLINNANWVYELNDIFTYYDLYPKMHSNGDEKQIKDRISEIIDENLLEDDLQSLEVELSYLERIMEKYKISLETEINVVRERIADLENKIEETSESNWESAKNRSDLKKNSINDSEIHELFLNLKEYRGI